MLEKYNEHYQRMIKYLEQPMPKEIEELEKAGEELMFRKAWDYIKYINLNNNFHIECIKLKADDKLVSNLEESICFFEALEEYEKCALLKKIEDKAKEFLASDLDS